MVSESGTSALVRELAQVFGRINDTQRSDWIGEGFAEYYAIELVRRAGGMSDERYESLQERLSKDSQNVTTLRGEQVSPAQVSKAVVLMQELDREIRLKTRNKRSLDDVLRGAMRLESVDTKAFVQLSESVLGESSKVLGYRADPVNPPSLASQLLQRILVSHTCCERNRSTVGAGLPAKRP